MKSVRALACVVVFLGSVSARASTPGWSNAGNLNFARALGATITADGHIYEIGGRNCPAGKGSASEGVIEEFDPVTNSWSIVAEMLVPREGFAAVPLHDGRILIGGGQTTVGICSSRVHVPVVTTEIFDPATNMITPSAAASSQRPYPLYSPLTDGRAIMVGGETSPKTSEVYSPSTDGWSPFAIPSYDPTGGTLTLLRDGKVLLAGGTMAAAEVFDPSVGLKTWLPTADPNFAHQYGAATLLRDGRVLLTGGDDGGVSNATAEIFDPVTETWTVEPNMPEPREGQIASLLPDGKVLVSAGVFARNTKIKQLVTSDIFDPATHTWTAGSSLSAGHENVQAATLPDGRVVIAGGGYEDIGFTQTAEIYSE